MWKTKASRRNFVCVSSAWCLVWSPPGMSKTPHTLFLGVFWVVQVWTVSLWATALLSWWSTVWWSVVRERQTHQIEAETVARAANCFVHGLMAALHPRCSFSLLYLLLFCAWASTARCLGSVAVPVSSWMLFNCCLSRFEVGIYFFIFDLLTATGSNLELIKEDEHHNTATSPRIVSLRPQILA